MHKDDVYWTLLVVTKIDNEQELRVCTLFHKEDFSTIITGGNNKTKQSEQFHYQW